MRSGFIALFVVFILAIDSIAFAETNNSQIMKLVKHHKPKVTWEKIVGHGDINCDGIDDYVVKGKADKRVYIDVVLGPVKNTSTVTGLDFGIGCEKYQDSLFEKNPTVQIVPLDYDPEEELGGALEGFQRSKKCKGIEVGGEESDPMNIYWNHKTNSIGWWRL